MTGTHGGVDHTMCYFPPEAIEKMTGHEQFLVKAYGQGLKLLDHKDVYMMNIDPDLFEQIPIQETKTTIQFPVVCVLPPYLMGAGLGSDTMMEGDYDIMTQDKKANDIYGINQLRFGDFVAIKDHDSTYGPHYKQGAITIGIVVHSDSFTSGHGPGLTIVATSATPAIEPVIEAQANLVQYKDALLKR